LVLEHLNKSGIYLQLGDSKNFKIVLVDRTNELQEVVVKSVKDNTFNSNRTGAQTVINSDQIKSLPSLSRNIADFARLTPQAQISGDDVLSIGGQNNRYNAIYIDGAVNNDVLDYLQTVLMVVKQELAYLLMLLSNFK
jgi:hypothetical protein